MTYSEWSSGFNDNQKQLGKVLRPPDVECSVTFTAENTKVSHTVRNHAASRIFSDIQDALAISVSSIHVG